MLSRTLGVWSYLHNQALCEERWFNAWEVTAVRGVASPATSETRTSLGWTHQSRPTQSTDELSFCTHYQDWREKMIPNTGKEEEQPESSCAVDRCLKWYSDLTKVSSSIFKSSTSTLWQSFHFSVSIQEKLKLRCTTILQQNILLEALFMIAQNWKQPGCPSIEELRNKLWYIHMWTIITQQKGTKLQIGQKIILQTSHRSLLIKFYWNRASPSDLHIVRPKIFAFCFFKNKFADSWQM